MPGLCFLRVTKVVVTSDMAQIHALKHRKNTICHNMPPLIYIDQHEVDW